MASCTSVVRLGPSGDTALLLKNALLHYFSASTEESETLSTQPLISISNKYFDAQVLLKALAELSSSAETEKEDGVILVFDALQCNPDLANGSSFDQLDAVHNGNAGDLLRLCIGISLGDWSAQELRGNKHEDEYSKRILWCLDRGYEYAEINLSQEGQLAGHDERDKEGFARIIEAIQGTVWSSAVMKERTVAVKPKVEVKEEVDEARTNAYEPPNPDEIDGRPSLGADPPIMQEYLNEPESKEEREQRESSKTEEKAFTQLEGLMREAGRIREMSKAGEMDDDSRRQRAGDAAMLMSNLMQQMGLDGDESGEEDDSDEEDQGNAN